MANDNEVMGQVMFDKAQTEYPYLADKNIAFEYAPSADPKENRLLEFYAPDEPGDPNSPKPASFAGRPGVQVLSPQVRPIDILADYVSHYGVNTDPKLQQLYQQFSQQVDPAQMQQRYQYHQQNLGEKRPYEDWYKQTGLPEYFRGYTFNQWEKPEEMYNPQQLQTLNLVRQYLGIK